MRLDEKLASVASSCEVNLTKRLAYDAFQLNIAWCEHVDARRDATEQLC